MVGSGELVGRVVAQNSLQSRRERAKRFAREITRTPVAGDLAIGPRQSTIADIDERDPEKAAQRGFMTVVLAEDGPLPFGDKELDVVLSNSRIEHVTGRKSDAFLPRPLLLRLIGYINTHGWVKSTIGDFNLLNARQMQGLFPESRIIRERFWPIPWTTKSITASF